MLTLGRSKASTLSFSLSVALSFVTLISFFILSSSTTSASDYVSNVSVTVPVSCNITSALDTTHTETINPGQYKADIGTTTFKVFCNDNTGYAVYAIGYSNDEYGNTNMLPTNPSTSTNPSIATGTATSGNTSNWAMKLNYVDGTYKPTIENGFGSYKAVPDTYAKVASLNTNTDFTIGSSFQSTYRVFVSQTQPADTYTGKVKYTLVHPHDTDPPLQPHAATPKCISYWPNASGIVDSMADDCNKSEPSGSGYNNNATVTLWASNFRRDGYGFAGWSDKFDWVLNENDEDGNGTGPNAGYHIYGPNATITTPSNMTDKGLSLYAVWVTSEGNLQNWNGCSSMSVGEVTALKDQRDHNAYAIAKLADGNCWMIENLRLDNTNTDNATGDLAQGYGQSTTYGNFSGLAEPETANFDGSTTANSLYYSGTQSGTASVNIDTINYPNYRFPRFNNQNITSPATQMTGINSNAYSYGNYYTWPAAIADTTYYRSGTHAETSICPKGWHIPYGDTATTTGGGKTSGGFSYLDSALGGTGEYQSTTEASQRWHKYPNNFIYSGHFTGTASYRGGFGYYWSATAVNRDRSYNLNLTKSFVYPGTYDGDGLKFVGQSIRCVQ